MNFFTFKGESYLKILNKRNITLYTSIILLLLITLIISSYQGVWRHVFSKAQDISKDMLILSKQYYSSKYHIWYGSFTNFHLILFLIIPVVTSTIYAKSYYNQTDIYYIYRQGFKGYYIKNFLKVTALLAVILASPIIIYWLLLNVFPTTNKVFIEGVGKEIAPVVPSITIINNSIKSLAVQNPNGYVYYTMAVFIISGVNYGIYAYALGNFMKSRIFRYLSPIISLTIIDFIIGAVIPNFNDSILFDTFNTAALLDNKYILVFNLCLFLFSLLLLAIHYAKRSREG